MSKVKEGLLDTDKGEMFSGRKGSVRKDLNFSMRNPLSIVTVFPSSLGWSVQTQQMSNSSSISHFLLLPLADRRQLQLLHFCLFLAISLAALLATASSSAP